MVSPILAARISAGRARLASAFCTSSGQLRAFSQISGGRPDDGTWADVGDPRPVCLYRPKGSTVPEPLAMIDKTMFMLAWDDTIPWGLTHLNRVMVDGREYVIHDEDTERSNALLSTARVSLLR